ncbi:MAG: hydantoinase B/oxoprolinase family protein [Nitrososphaerales archaeon]
MAKIDPISFQVIRHKLLQVTDEMGSTLRLISSSPTVTEVGDYCSAICLEDGEIAVMGAQVTAFAWSVGAAIKNVIDNKSIIVDDGDMLILNDPWLGCLHQSDTAVIAPVYYRGKLFCWSGSMTHQLDIGAISPGGINPAATEVYHEGLRFPPIKLVERGKLRQDLFNMILNMVRVPQVGLDIKGQIATNNVCKERITKLCDHYGADVVKQVMRQDIKLSEKRLRQRLRELPDGRFRHIEYIDHDGQARKLYKLPLMMEKEKDRLHFDFTGVSGQSPGFINCTLSGSWGGVVGAVYPWLCYDISWNGGLLLPLSVSAPEGSFINARVPAAVSYTTLGALNVIRNASEICISKMLACTEKYKEGATAVWHGSEPKVLLGGTNQFHERYVYVLMDNLSGGGGAKATNDGVDSGGETSSSEMTIPNIETHEAGYPLLFLARRQTIDSGGAGKFRGGVGCEILFVPYGSDKLELTFASRGVDVPPSAGIFGGYPSNLNRAEVIRASPFLSDMKKGKKLPAMLDDVEDRGMILPACVHRLTLESNDAFFYRWDGGGGYGDPLDRDPEEVIKDTRDGTVSAKLALKIYGVVMSRDGEFHDSALTERERRRIRFKRARTHKLRQGNFRQTGLLPLGPYLGIDPKRNDVKCVCCGYVFCRLNGNPKEHAGVRESKIGNGKFPGGEELVRKEYFCPGCGSLFSNAIEIKGSRPLFDVELAPAAHFG